MANETERTRGKVRRLRGSATLQEDGTFGFRPDGIGCARMEDVRSARKSRCYRTAGEKQQSVVAHLTVAADAEDPAYELYRDFLSLTRGMAGYERLPVPAGRVLERTDDFHVSMNQRQGRIEAAFRIDLRQHVDFMKQFYELLNRMSRCLYFNEDFLKQQCRALARTGSR